MQPFRSIKKFFRTRYVKTVEFFAARFMTFAISMMHYLMALKGKDLAHVEKLATNFAVLTAGLMRELIVLKGKDPDYVAPPPPPPPEPVKEAPLYVAGSFVGAQPSYIPSWVAASFKDIWKHPVMKSRLEFEAKEALRKAPRVVAPDPSLVVTISPNADLEVIDTQSVLMPTIEEVKAEDVLSTEEVVH